MGDKVRDDLERSQASAGKYQIQTDKAQSQLDKTQSEFDRMQEKFERSQNEIRKALKGSKIQVETSYCSQDPRDRFNSSNYSYRTHHPTYRVMMSFLFYLCLFLYHILLSLPINLFF